MTGSRWANSLRERIDDLRFAFQSDRPTWACYRDIRANRQVMGVFESLIRDRPEGDDSE